MFHYVARCEACRRDFTGQSVAVPNDGSLPCPKCGSHKIEVCDFGTALTLEEAKAAIDAGKAVYWANGGYECTKDRFGQYLCTYLPKHPKRSNTAGMEACGDRGFFMHP